MTDNVTVTNAIWTYTLPIIGLVIAAITAFGVFYGPRLAANWQRRQEEQDVKLKAHFEDLKGEATSKTRAMISALTEWQRKINTYDNFAYTNRIELPDPSNSFVAHLPELTKDYSKHKQRIREHFENYEQLRLVIKDDFKSKEIPMVSDSTNQPLCVHDVTFVALFRWWVDIAQNAPNPQPDFTQIETKKADSGYHLYASKLGAFPVAYGKTYTNKEKCEHALSEVAQNNGYKGKAAELFNSKDGLLKELQSYDRCLGDKLRDVEKFWPGPKKGYRFEKRMKSCPRCKEIFG